MATKKVTSGKSQPKSVTKKPSIRKPATDKIKETTKIEYREKRFGDSIIDEIILIVLILINGLVLFSLFSTSMGIMGRWINALLKGLLGFGAFILPILIICFSTWALFSKTRKYMQLRAIAVIMFTISLSTMLHFLNGNMTSNSGILKLISELYSNGSGVNGGVFGGLFSLGLTKVFGRGGYFIILFLCIISVIMGTGKSLFAGIATIYRHSKNKKKRREAHIKAEAQYIREREEEEEKRLKARDEKKARKKGNFNIKIGNDEGLNPRKDIPVVEAMVFKNEQKSMPKETENIYDYNNDCNNDTESKTDTNEDPIAEETFEPIILMSNSDDESIIESDKAKCEDLIAEDIVAEDITGDVVDTAISNERAREDTNSNTEGQSETARVKTEKGDKDTSCNIEIKTPPVTEKYEFPPTELLGKNPDTGIVASKGEMLANAKKLEETLKSFGVDAKVIQINKGPTVTRYELSPSQGVKVSKIVNLSDDIALNLAASGIRIEAPIPGKAAVGIEVPNKETQSVYLRSVIDSDTFRKFPSKLAFALGEDIAGKAIVTDIAKMPHLLIAGATGSGKSVCINTLITSILYKADPNEVKLLMIDPKVVELSVYNGIPHLLIPVVTDPKKAAGALNWAVREMLERYQGFAEYNVRDISGYNSTKKEKGEKDLMPQIVVIIDELADLMMAAPGDVEDSICRLAQMARAAGIHLIIATQRPSVDVITGVIKANIPSRLAFSVSSGTDSRTILDMVGAEKLLGKGDMLFYPVGMSKPVRIQGAFVTDKEVESIVGFVKKDKTVAYDKEMIDKITESNKNTNASEDSDEFLEQAIELVVEKEKASVSMFQRQFRIGFNRAARLMDDLEQRGIVGQEEGSKPRKVLMTKNEYHEYKNGNASQDVE